MQGKVKERWMELCEQAAIEQDHERLLQLVSEITRMLEEKDQRLQHQHSQQKKPRASFNF